MQTNPQSNLAAKYASFPVLTPYSVSTQATQDPADLCSTDCRRNCSMSARTMCPHTYRAEGTGASCAAPCRPLTIHVRITASARSSGIAAAAVVITVASTAALPSIAATATATFRRWCIDMRILQTSFFPKTPKEISGIIGMG